MKSRPFSIEINQALHGYLRGHTLLASSTNLSSQDERRMLRLSDMSGLSMTKGFETYITGYPLVGREAYVVARTWYAPETSRPGCVWTHSLIIDNNNLEWISQPQILMSLFVRPEGDWKSRNYAKSILIDVKDIKENDKDYDISRPLDFEQILFALYNNPRKQIFVSTDNASSLERLLFGIWEYQWGGLRKSFSFSTGSIENRSSSELVFDIQVIPDRNRAGIQRKNPDEIFLPDNFILKDNYPPWVSFLGIQLLQHTFSSPFKEYLNTVGRDLFDGRSAYSKLVNIYFLMIDASLTSQASIFNVVETVSREFPDSDEASELKSFLFGGKDDLAKIGNRQWTESDLLRAFCTLNIVDALEPQILRIKERTEALLFSDPDATRKLLGEILALTPNPLREEFILAIYEKIDSETALFMAKQDVSILRMLLYNYPMIVLETSILNISLDSQLEMFDIMLSSPRLSPEVLTDVIRFALNNKIDYLAEKIFRHSQELAVPTILDWIRNNCFESEFEITKSWKGQLIARPGQIMKWLSKTEWDKYAAKAICYLASSLDSNSREILAYGSEFWTIRQVDYLEGLDTAEKAKYSTFLLAVAMSTDDSKTAPLLALSFLTVHNAAKESSLLYESWRQISDKLPELIWYQSWDKCERLRRGFVDQFIEKQLDPIYFFQGTTQADVFEKLLQYSLERNKIKKYIFKILDDFPSYKRSLSEMQQRLLRQYEFI